MKLVVTGSTDAPLGIGERIAIHLSEFKDVTECISGCAFGIDSIFARIAKDRWPDIRHTLIIPAGYHNWSLYDPPNFDLYHMARRTNYLDRNQEMINRMEEGDILLAYPKSANEILRSGTWSTIRRGRKAGVEIRIHPLNGDKSWIENAKN